MAYSKLQLESWRTVPMATSGRLRFLGSELLSTLTHDPPTVRKATCEIETLSLKGVLLFLNPKP